MTSIDRICKWVFDFSKSTNSERKKFKDLVLSRIPDEELRRNLASNAFVPIGFVPCLRLIPKSEDHLRIYVFSEPGVLLKHKFSPSLVVVYTGGIIKERGEKDFGAKTENGVVSYLSWAKTYAKSPKKDRKDLENLVFDGLRAYSDEKEVNSSTSEGKKIVEFFQGNSVELLGVTPLVEYFTIDDRGDEQEALFVHPFGGITLCYKSKNDPCLFLVNPALRYNDSFLRRWNNEIERVSLMGITG